MRTLLLFMLLLLVSASLSGCMGMMHWARL
jgi:predicted small secreted protein